MIATESPPDLRKRLRGARPAKVKGNLPDARDAAGAIAAIELLVGHVEEGCHNAPDIGRKQPMRWTPVAGGAHEHLDQRVELLVERRAACGDGGHLRDARVGGFLRSGGLHAVGLRGIRQRLRQLRPHH